MSRLGSIALFLATTLAAHGQSLPDYTFGPAFGNTFNNGIPGLYNGGRGLNTNAMPGGFYEGTQSPFLTMPAYPFATPAYPPLGTASNSAAPQAGLPQAQPLPYWMQTPQSPRPQARFIEAIPAAPRPTRQARTPTAPPRWAPLSGKMPVVTNRPQTGNSWRFAPSTPPRPAGSAPLSAPPKWHSE